LGFRCRNGPAIGSDARPAGDLGKEVLGQLAVFGKLHGPGLAAEHVLDSVEVEVDATHWRCQVGDVPGPDLVHR